MELQDKPIHIYYCFISGDEDLINSIFKLEFKFKKDLNELYLHNNFQGWADPDRK